MLEAPIILFEDQHLIVLSKPAGLLSQGEESGAPNLLDWLRAHVGRPYLGLVHRLDRNTSGAMVVAKRTKSAQRLTEALRSGSLARSYLAWIGGTLASEARWRHFLLKDEAKNITRVVPDASGGAPGDAKEAILRVRPLARALTEGNPVTLAEFVLETGRSHQIRVQAAAEGHALIGDAKYGGIHSGLIARPALHSHRIAFPHPMTRERMSFIAPLPDDFKRIGGSSLSDIDRLLELEK